MSRPWDPEKPEFESNTAETECNFMFFFFREQQFYWVDARYVGFEQHENEIEHERDLKTHPISA